MHITCKFAISNLPKTCKVLTNNTKPMQFVSAYLNYPQANYVVKSIAYDVKNYESFKSFSFIYIYIDYNCI